MRPNDCGSAAATALMAKLAKRQGLSKKCGLTFVDDPAWPYLEIRKPVGVVGEAKQSIKDGPMRCVDLRASSRTARNLADAVETIIR